MPGGRPHRDIQWPESRQYLPRRLSIEAHHVELVFTSHLPCLEQDPRAIRRPTRIKPGGHNLSRQSRSTQRRYDEQAPLAILRSIRNIFPIGRPVWLPIVTWTLGYLHGIAAADLLHPNVEFAPAVRAVSD